MSADRRWEQRQQELDEHRRDEEAHVTPVEAKRNQRFYKWAKTKGRKKKTE